MHKQFQEIKSYENIKEIVAQSSSADGEDIRFELKGSNMEIKFNTETKNLFAKEICAFANSYGGILCIHFGRDKVIQKFPSDKINNLFKSIETWTRDSLEPRLLGIDLKIIEDLILIYIPESKNKPHRTAIKPKTYYYRHFTQSESMPEIMISSMYRSQDYLSTNCFVSLNKVNTQLTYNVSIINLSNISGTKPKIQVQIYSNEFSTKIEWQNHKDINQTVLNSYRPLNYTYSKNNGYYKESFKLKVPIISIIDTNIDFAKQTLYPLDSIELINYSNQLDNFKDLFYIIIHVDYFFKETTRQSKTFLFELNKNITKCIGTSDNYTIEELVNKYEELFNKTS